MRWLFFACLSLIAHEAPHLTGPLIAPVGTAVPYGDFLIKNYLFYGMEVGQYNGDWDQVSADHNLYRLRYQPFSFFGLTPWCDLNIIPRIVYSQCNHQQSANVGDLTVGLDIQLMQADATPYFPGIKLAVREIFPTGEFQFLHARKLQTDLTGMGTFATQFDLIFYKLFHLSGFHWLSWTLSGEYTINTPVSVHGFNAYGGGWGTRGKALPGNTFQAICSFEFTLNRTWALALDTVYRYTEATQFYGLGGISPEGTIAKVGGPCAKQLNFAPAIEANWTPHFGMIAGCYFSAMGKNSTVFRNAILNLNYFY